MTDTLCLCVQLCWRPACCTDSSGVLQACCAATRWQHFLWRWRRALHLPRSSAARCRSWSNSSKTSEKFFWKKPPDLFSPPLVPNLFPSERPLDVYKISWVPTQSHNTTTMICYKSIIERMNVVSTGDCSEGSLWLSDHPVPSISSLSVRHTTVYGCYNTVALKT